MRTRSIWNFFRRRRLQVPDVITDHAPSHEQGAVIASSGLFDRDWYLERNPEVRETGNDPLTHYLIAGAAIGTNPHPLFDTAWYLEQNPQVRLSSLNPLVHYLTHGTEEGRDPHPLFKTAFYLHQNPELRGTRTNPLMHYLQFGASDPHPLFDGLWYLAQYPDVRHAGINPLLHYLRWGASERRNPHPLFETEWYLAHNRDASSGGLVPLVHFIQHGYRDRRAPNPYFDIDRYLYEHPEIAQRGGNALEHYVLSHTYRAVKRREANARNAVATFLESLKEIEPSLRLSESLHTDAQWLVAARPAPSRKVAAWQAMVQSIHQPYEQIIFADTAGHHTPVVATLALKCAHRQRGLASTLFVITDEFSDVIPEWLPPGTHCRILSQMHTNLTHQDRVELVTALIYFLHPRAVLNLGSALCWQAFSQRASALAEATSLFAALFGRADGEEHTSIYEDGYFTRCFTSLTRVYVDSLSSRESLIQIFGIPPRLQIRIAVLYPPIEIPEERPARLPTSSDRVFVLFVVHIRSEKLLSLFSSIARKCPHFTFVVHGITPPVEDNVVAYTCAEDREWLSFGGEEYAAVIYVSQRPGLPRILLRAGIEGIPVIAPNATGVGELVSVETGWPIQSTFDTNAYVCALNSILTRHDETVYRTAKMRTLIQSRHSQDMWVSQFMKSPSFLD